MLNVAVALRGVGLELVRVCVIDFLLHVKGCVARRFRKQVARPHAHQLSELDLLLRRLNVLLLVPLAMPDVVHVARLERPFKVLERLEVAGRQRRAAKAFTVLRRRLERLLLRAAREKALAELLKVLDP